MRRSLLSCALIVFSLMAALAAAPAQASLEGRWDGSIELPGRALEIQVIFSPAEEGWHATITIPAQGAKDLALSDVVVEGDSVRFKIPGVPGEPSFDGKISEDRQTIAGDFSQGGGTFPFKLARNADKAGQAAEKLEGFGDFVRKAMEDLHVVGSGLAIVVDDQIVLAEGYGYRDLENKLPATADTLFAIGSSSKAFTTFSLGLLVDQGKIEWDAPVIRYLPAWRLWDEYATSHITVRDLVTHRSGLPRHDLLWYNNHDLTLQDIFERIRYLEPNKELRETFQYNNLMFAMAGYLVGDRTGRSWEGGVRELILKPLGMTRTNFSVAASQADPDHSLPYEVRDEKIERRAFRDISNMGPAGSINSSVKEMAQWMRVHLNEGKQGDERIIEKATLDEEHRPQMVIESSPATPMDSPTAYGMGWFASTHRGHYRVFHGGNIDGFSALVSLFPIDKMGIVVLCNQNGSPFPGVLTNHIFDRLMDLDQQPWLARVVKRLEQAREMQKEGESQAETVRVPDTHPSHALESYAGTYEHPGYGELAIAFQDDHLSLTYNGISADLEHWHYDVFNGLENPDDRTFRNMKVAFESNRKGDIDALTVPFEPALSPIRFTRQADTRLTDPDYLARFVGVYQLGPQEASISLKGSTLTLFVPGQPVYELVPYQGDEFNLKGIEGFSVAFEKSEAEGGMAAVFKQPNGVFRAERKAEEQ